MPVEISQNNFNDEVTQKPGLLLVDFWAEWCGPCRVLGPIMEEVAAELGEKARVGKINVDENSQLAGQFGVMSIPTVILFKDGQPVEQIIGVRSKQDYLDLVAKYQGQ